MLKLYWANAGQMELSAPPPLSAYRRARLTALKPELARRASLCAELLLNEAVRREEPEHVFPLDIQAGENGKPFFPARDFEFSLSHSEAYAACALASFPVGLDLQVLTPCSEALVRRFFTPKEQATVLSAADRDAAFTRLWCRKESFLKAIGLGLRLALDAFDVSGEAPSPCWEETEYRFFDYREGELFFCLCVPGDKGDALPPEIIRLAPRPACDNAAFADAPR